MTRQDENDERESRRILDRVSREAGSGMPTFLSDASQRLRDHVAAVNATQGDPIEYWGTRVGRGLGFVISLVLIVGLLIYLFQGG